jgi:RHS repeat-associated protein
LGTPLALTDQKGEIVWQAQHDAWGNITREYNPYNIRQDIRLPGQHQDRQTGLYYNRHRYYDPRLGAYINQDPVGLKGGEPNLFVYVKNPIQWMDPFGLQEAVGAQNQPSHTIVITDGGGRNGATYGGTMTVTTNTGDTVTVPVSSWPNPRNANPGIAEGEYGSVYRTTGHRGRTDGVSLEDGAEIPTLGPNPNNGNNQTATGINIHCGNTGTNRGSAGCITIDPEYCEEVWRILENNSRGTVIINR